MKILSLSKKELFLDIGSSNTRVYYQDKLVFNEPTCVAYHQDTNSVIAIGSKALLLLGKAPKSVKIGFPVQHGAIADTKQFQLFTTALLQQVFPKTTLRRMLFGLSGAFAVMSSLSPAKRRLLQTTLQKCGFSTVQLIDAAQAASLGIARGSKKEHESICLIDIGAQKTEVAVFSMGELISSRHFKWGGVVLTEQLQKISRNEHKCVVSWHLAEEAKKQIGTLEGSKKKCALQGKDLITQSGKTVVFSSEDVRAEFSLLVSELIEKIQDFIATLPSETAVSVLAKGVFLTGGTSSIKGIDSMLVKKLKCDVFLSNNPQADVINGLLKYDG